MSIASEITRLQNIKTSIRSALVTQGVPAASGHDMADFSADILSISTGGGATITVTYSSQFYNKTMTCTKGTKTYTKTTTSSGSTVFDVDESGTWTITCDGVSRTVDVVLEYSTQMAITKTITVYSAASDTVSFTDATGAKTVTTDTSGQGSVSITFIPPSASITFTSSVAKNPNDLSQAYSKAITIDTNTTDIYVMPNGALYWWGNNRGVSEYTAGSISSSAGTKGTVTFNNQSVTMYNSTYPSFSQIASNNTINFTDYTALKCIGNDGNVNGMEHGIANTSHTLISGYSKMWTQDTTTRLYTLDITSCTATGYAYVSNPYYNGTGTCYALWLE